MAKFILKSVLMLAVPTVVLVAVYFLSDPVHLLKDRNEEAGDYMTNCNLLAVRKFDRYNDSVRYDSFIVGSSINWFYKSSVWRKYLPDSARIFHVDGSSLNIAYLEQNISWLARRSDMRHVLIMVPLESFGWADSHGLAFDLPAEVRNSVWGKADAYRHQVSGFYNYKMAASYISRILLDVEPVGHNAIVRTRIEDGYDPVRNEHGMTSRDVEMLERCRAVHESFPWLDDACRRIPVSTAKVMIDDQVAASLRHIASLLSADAADYRLVVVPSVRMEKISPEDDRVLREIFGERYLDLSQEYAWLFMSDGYTYDHIHIASWKTDEILKRIYASRDSLTALRPSRQDIM